MLLVIQNIIAIAAISVVAADNQNKKKTYIQKEKRHFMLKKKNGIQIWYFLMLIVSFFWAIGHPLAARLFWEVLSLQINLPRATLFHKITEKQVIYFLNKVL